MAANLTVAIPAANVSRATGDQRLTNHTFATMYGVPVIADGDQITAAGIVIGTTGIYHLFSGALWGTSSATHGVGYWKNGTIASRITSSVTTDRSGNFMPNVSLVAGDVIALNTYQPGTQTLLAQGDQTYIAAVRLA